MNNSEHEKEYGLIAHQCELFARELTHQLEELLSQENISLGFPLQNRVKKFDSVLKKIQRAALKIQYVKELDDLIGLRIILLFQRDVESVRALIKKNLTVFSEEDTQTRLNEGEFGYTSIHFQVGLKPSWQEMPTFKKIRDLKAEIQVRTVAQHLWAAASHFLQYKQEAGVPPPVRRSIHRVSALLETVDLEFERVLKERTTYLSRKKISSGQEVLNVDLLASILDKVFPSQNKQNEKYADLLQDLFLFSVKTESQLGDLLAKHRATILKDDKRMAEKYSQDEETSENLRKRAGKGVFWSHEGLVRRALYYEFGKEWLKHVGTKYPKLFAKVNPKKS